MIGRGNGCRDKFVLREVLMVCCVLNRLLYRVWNVGARCMWGDRRRLVVLSTMRSCVCVRKVYWKGCGNAATARDGLDTA